MIKRNQGKKMKKKSLFPPRIKKLMKDRDVSQVGLSKLARISQSKVSLYLSGDEQPSAAVCAVFGNLASYPDNLWFWERGGMDKQAMKTAIGKSNKEEGAPPAPGEVVRIPRFHETLKGREPAGTPIALPSEFIPNPLSTIAILTDEQSTTVVDAPRGLFILDTSIEGVQDLSELWTRVVILRHPGIPGKLTGWPAGIYAGRLTLEWSPRSMGTGDIVFDASLSMLGKESGHYSLPLGSYASREAMKEIPSQDEVTRRTVELQTLARTEFRLDASVRILGKVIGRLTGHLGTEPKSKS